MSPADVIRIKELLPTRLGSDEVRERIARDILSRSVFSARMESARHLAKIRDVCAGVAAGEINQATARARLMEHLAAMGHSPLDEGGLANPASIVRLNLIIETQTQMAASVARMDAQTPAVVANWPAWRLERVEDRALPRKDWARRWAAAGEAVGWEGAVEGEMVALKDSPIWQALGDGAGGFRDTLGNPYPPFAYGSGMDWTDVDAEECAALGLSTGGANAPEAATLSPGEREIADAVKRLGFDFNSVAGGLQWT
jgi:hypothetical protein